MKRSECSSSHKPLRSPIRFGVLVVFLAGVSLVLSGAYRAGSAVLYVEHTSITADRSNGIRVRLDPGPDAASRIRTVEFTFVYPAALADVVSACDSREAGPVKIHATGGDGRRVVRIENVSVLATGSGSPAPVAVMSLFPTTGQIGRTGRFELEDVRILDQAGAAVPASARGANFQVVPLPTE